MLTLAITIKCLASRMLNSKISSLIMIIRAFMKGQIIAYLGCNFSIDLLSESIWWTKTNVTL